MRRLGAISFFLLDFSSYEIEIVAFRFNFATINSRILYFGLTALVVNLINSIQNGLDFFDFEGE